MCLCLNMTPTQIIQAYNVQWVTYFLAKLIWAINDAVKKKIPNQSLFHVKISLEKLK